MEPPSEHGRSSYFADRYTLEREIGRGAMSSVHVARDRKYGRPVAIKILLPEFSQALGSRRFLQEISIAATLHSPHILPLLDSGEDDDRLFYVMPYVEGPSLRGVLAERGPLAPPEVLRILREVADALDYAHRHGVVHRDIKPDNILIAERHAIVADFGIAKALSDSTVDDRLERLTSIGISIGTPAYMAPEQAAADPDIDHRADIYAVGIVAYEMLTGQLPFTGPPQAVLSAQITAEPPPLLQVRPDIPVDVARLVARCMEKDRALRYQTAGELLRDIESLLASAGVQPATARRSRVLRVGLAAAALVIAVLVTVAGVRIRSDRWVHRTALPALSQLVEAGETDSAFALALRIRDIAPRDSALTALMGRFTRRMVLRSEPAGARVYRAPMADTSRWTLVGTTPTDSVHLPIAAGLYRFEKPGFRTRYSLFSLFPRDIPAIHLQPDTARADMLRISGGMTRAFLVGTDAAPPTWLDDYELAAFEVTNREYKAFVDAGGYHEQKYWEHPFVEDGRPLAPAEAMRRFVDRTGQPGPSTWEGGSHAPGEDNIPVGGVSWYEAAAYAKYAGASLPTIYHWARAARIWDSRFIVQASVLQSRAARPVGTLRGVTIAGVSDMAGNVREWIMNETEGGQRFILGGGWSDPAYAFTDAGAHPPMNRAAINGIRLARYAPTDTTLARASRRLARAITDYHRVAHVTDAVFAAFRPQFDFDPIPLQPTLELRDTLPEDWIREKVSFAAAYGRERMSAWLFLPRRGTPPYQTVVFFPSSGALGSGPHPGTPDSRMSFILQSGRAAVLPIYKSTFERSDSLRSDIPNTSVFWRDHVVMWVKDFRRTLDYLSTRADMDTSKFAYFGFSWGGYMGGIIPAVEPRIKTAVLYVAGLTMERPRPEVDPINYLPRIRVPVLMLNGRYDFFFPTETSQRPFFERLGTPAAHKAHKVYDGGHDVPRTQLITETLRWLDRALGPVPAPAAVGR